VFTRIFALLLRDEQLETLATCMRVNRQLYRVAGPILYRYIELGTDFLYPPTQRRYSSEPNVLLDISLVPSRMMTANGKRKPRPKLKANLLTYTRELVIRNHPKRICQSADLSGFAGSLRSLSLLRFDLEDGSAEHPHPQGGSNTCGYAQLIIAQRDTTTLEKMVFRGVICRGSTFPSGFPLVPFSARRVVLALAPWDYTEGDSIDMKCDIFRKTETLVLIFWTAHPSTRWESPKLIHQRTSFGARAAYRPTNLALLVAGSACQSASLKEVLVVGAGLIDERLVTTRTWNEGMMQTSFEARVRAAVTEESSEPDEKERMEGIQKKLRFCSVKEYLEREDCQGVFDEDEVRPFMQTYANRKIEV
jgi:hypothetical protein